MSQDNSAPMKREVGKRLVKVVIAVLALLMIRVIMDHLPMLKNASPIVVGGNSLQTTNMSQNASEAYSAWLSSLRSNPTSADMQRAAQEVARSCSGVGMIFPISIANAIVDSLIFVVLILSAMGFKRLIQAQSRRLPEGGVMILLLVLTIVVALAYGSYDGIFPPLLGTDANLYGWFFLVLGLVPLVGLIVVGARNMDAVTEVIFASASRTLAGSSQAQPVLAGAPALCQKCGSVLELGVKFCSSCGAPVVVARAQAEKFCSSCGAKNSPNAKFCQGCGKPLSIVNG